MNPIQFYKCLADETRLQSLLLISHEKELCVCELTEALQVSQPKISRHLAQLRECGLLKDRRSSQWIFYSINPSLPQWAIDVIALTAQENRDFIQKNHQRLLDMGSRPDRNIQCC
jgi:ArsR family transcriptional regulator